MNVSLVTQEDRGILHSVPEGLRNVLNYIKDKYNNPTVYIKENGENLCLDIFLLIKIEYVVNFYLL